MRTAEINIDIVSSEATIESSIDLDRSGLSVDLDPKYIARDSRWGHITGNIEDQTDLIDYIDNETQIISEQDIDRIIYGG